MRVGIGYDVHPLVGGRALVLGGVHVPYEKGLEGYSDADVLLHAVMDALLGAAGLDDIGRQFPAGDPQYKNISSLVLLARTAEIVRRAGWQVGNIDSIIVAERPRLSPFLDEMRRRIAEALGIDRSRVGVKATTSEGIGFAGRGEGMAAQAVALLEQAQAGPAS